MRLFCMFAITAALFGLLVGCSTKRLPDYPTLSAHQYANKDTQNDLTVAIHPMTEENEIKQYFGINLLADDILPVFVVIENRNREISFILRKQEIQLLNEGCRAHDANESSRKIESSESAAEAVAVISPWIGTSMFSKNEEVRRNFAMKELQQTTVSPGDAKSGFVFFQLPKPDNSPNRWRLQIQTMNLRSKMPLTFTYTFDWQRS